MSLSPLSPQRRARKTGRYVALAVLAVALAGAGTWYFYWPPMAADMAGEAKGEGEVKAKGESKGEVQGKGEGESEGSSAPTPEVPGNRVAHDLHFHV